MCGIAGFLGFRNLTRQTVLNVAQKMGVSISHRGPDDAGIWCDDDASVVLVHRRLSILDLSPAGHQPMVSSSGRYIIVFNGEIYNHRDLRRSLGLLALAPGFGTSSWRGHSDTETLLAAIEAWGFEETLKRCIGMFSIALWDREERSLTLARDRIGEKPLYYGWQGGVFLFGSELKALKIHPAFEGRLNRRAIALQMRYNYIPSPTTIYEGICKLKPGHYVKVTAESKDQQLIPLSYWSFPDVVERGRSLPFPGTDAEAVEALDTLLKSAVSQQMEADVPLGGFLSGGIDSSTIVALMQAQSTKPVRTFTIGFNEDGYNEATHAKAVAEYLGTEHTELYVSSSQALDVIPMLPALYDEPFSDSSQIPTFLVSQLTRQHVAVSLSGDAGDELFGGYNRYLVTNSIWEKIQILPASFRNAVSSLMLAIPHERYNALSKLPFLRDYANIGDKVHKLATVISSQTWVDLYHKLISHWAISDGVVIGEGGESTGADLSLLRVDGIIEQMMALDTLTYLPDDILCKVDRAAMGVSLETRVPMLDHRVVEFAWALPMRMKIRHGTSKWILREVLHKYVPKSLVERPKMGFGVPIDSWLRGPLRDWAEDLIGETRLQQEGYFDPVPIRKKWDEHLSGQRNWQYHLWDVLMFQSWLGHQRG